MGSVPLGSEEGSPVFSLICRGKFALVKGDFSRSDTTRPKSKGYCPHMRTIKLTHEQFRIWRLNAPPDAENELGARDRIKKELLERNGGQTFRLRSPMGPFLTTVRGENNSPGAPTMAANGAPSPEACICKAYAGTPPGKHHPICQHRAAWEAGNPAAKTGTSAPAPLLNPEMRVESMRVMPPIDTTPKVQHMMVPKPVSATQAPIRVDAAPLPSQALPRSIGAAPLSTGSVPVAVVQTPAVQALIPPDQCDCRHFTKPSDADPTQHHFVCQHFERWKIAHPTPKPEETKSEQPVSVDGDTEKPPPPEEQEVIDYVLVDLDERRVLRDATHDEVTRARDEEAKNGSPIITLDEGVYAVVPRPAPEQSSAENHGA